MRVSPRWPCVPGCTLALLLTTALVGAQSESRTYTDSRGKKIVFPLGDASFADEVVSFELGKPSPPDLRWTDPSVALGSPNYDRTRDDPANPSNVVLGCAGTLVVRFNDNALVDVPGADLYVFEVGPAVEGLALAISTDAMTWTEAGRISGGTAEVDIAHVAKPGERYRYVRVSDLKSACGGRFPGADIDAIGAIGSAFQIALDASVLFEFNKAELRPQARSAMIAAAASISARQGQSILVEGHTDNVGADDYNRTLSLARAEAVRAFLMARPELKGRTIAATGLGASRPVASNGTDQGRQLNRRVEIVISPSK